MKYFLRILLITPRLLLICSLILGTICFAQGSMIQAPVKAPEVLEGEKSYSLKEIKAYLHARGLPPTFYLLAYTDPTTGIKNNLVPVTDNGDFMMSEDDLKNTYSIALPTKDIPKDLVCLSDIVTFLNQFENDDIDIPTIEYDQAQIQRLIEAKILTPHTASQYKDIMLFFTIQVYGKKSQGINKTYKLYVADPRPEVRPNEDITQEQKIAQIIANYKR